MANFTRCFGAIKTYPQIRLLTGVGRSSLEWSIFTRIVLCIEIWNLPSKTRLHLFVYLFSFVWLKFNQHEEFIKFVLNLWKDLDKDLPFPEGACKNCAGNWRAAWQSRPVLPSTELYWLQSRRWSRCCHLSKYTGFDSSLLGHSWCALLAPAGGRASASLNVNK